MKFLNCLMFLFAAISLSFINPIGVKEFTIEGHIQDLPSTSKLFLVANESRDTIAITESNNGQFHFSGKIGSSHEWVSIRIENLDQWPTFILGENSTISIKGAAIEWGEAIVKGSIETDNFYNLRRTFEPYQKQYDSCVAESRKHDSNDSILIEKARSISDSIKLIKDKFINDHLNSAYTAWLIKNTAFYDLETKRILFDKLLPDAKESSFGIALKNMLESIKSRKDIFEGSIIPNFSFEDLSGRHMSLYDIISKNKLTLIDMWASWCTPCRKAIPELKSIYEEYQQRGLGLVSISTDKSRKAWENAVHIEGILWPNWVQNGKYQALTDVFDIQAIPAYILVDNKGRILALNNEMSSVQSFGLESQDNVLRAFRIKIGKLLLL